MRKSLKMIKKETMIPIPGIGDENVTRALCAMHIEKHVMCENLDEYYAAAGEILDELNIGKDRLLEFVKYLNTYDDLIKALVSRSYEAADGFVKKGRFYYSYKDYYFSKGEEGWEIDLERLQEDEAKYDNVDLFLGQVILKFNPTTKDDIMIDNTGFPVPTLHSLECDSDDDHTCWNEFVSKECKDRDVVLIYQDGVEIERF